MHVEIQKRYGDDLLQNGGNGNLSRCKDMITNRHRNYYLGPLGGQVV